jgi:hypothetical protein
MVVVRDPVDYLVPKPPASLVGRNTSHELAERVTPHRRPLHLGRRSRCTPGQVKRYEAVTSVVMLVTARSGCPRERVEVDVLKQRADALAGSAHWCTILVSVVPDGLLMHPWSPPDHRQVRSTFEVHDEFCEVRWPRIPRPATGLCADERRSVSDRRWGPGSTGCSLTAPTAR